MRRSPGTGRIDSLLLTAIGAHGHLLLSTSIGTVTTRQQTDALRGSLDLLILKTLSLTPMHGWGITRRIQQTSKGILDVNLGSLYPALQRLEKNGLITSDWGTTDNNRRARYYQIT